MGKLYRYETVATNLIRIKSTKKVGNLTTQATDHINLQMVARPSA